MEKYCYAGPAHRRIDEVPQVSERKESMRGLSVLQELRCATSEAHQRLHHHPLTYQLTSPNLTETQYIDVLKAFYGFYKPCEQSVSAYAKSRASRALWLEQDLTYFACPVQAIDLCVELPVLRSEQNILGYLYVIEGSSLGSRIIMRCLQNSLSLTAHTGARFFSAYSGKTAEHWRHMQQLLASQSSFHHHTIVQSACDVFRTLESWLWRCHGEAI